MMFSESDDKVITIVDIFCEFIEVAIHNILYVRKLYPDSIFERKRKYGAVVYSSKHPDVNQYITNCLNAINFHLKRNQLKAVLLCFNDANKTLERYRFNVIKLDSCFESDPFLVKLEQFFYDFCLRLHSSVANFSKLSDEATFSIQLEVTEYANLEYIQDPSHEEFLWINSGNQEHSSTAIIPLQTFETVFFNVQAFIESLS